MYKLKAEALSNRDIVYIAGQLRNLLECPADCSINIMAVLEFAMPQLIPNLEYLIKNKNEMKFDKHAYFDPEENAIVIREDIYDRARHREGRDRFTIAHEIGHCILHNASHGILARVYPTEKLKAYEDPEWQADAFAGELLCPICALKNTTKTPEQIAKKFGVSLQAAKAQIKKAERCFQQECC